MYTVLTAQMIFVTYQVKFNLHFLVFQLISGRTGQYCFHNIFSKKSFLHSTTTVFEKSFPWPFSQNISFGSLVFQ